MGRGSTQEPPCRFYILHFRCTVVAICLGGNDLVQMEMLHLAVALKYILLDPSRIWSSTLSCQV